MKYCFLTVRKNTLVSFINFYSFRPIGKSGRMYHVAKVRSCTAHILWSLQLALARVLQMTSKFGLSRRLFHPRTSVVRETSCPTYIFPCNRAPLNTMAWERWEQVDDNMRAKMAPLACSAAWATNSWDQVERYVSALPADDSFDGAFYRAVLNIHSGNYTEACEHIVNARNVLDADLTTMAGESYDRAYADLVGTQLLSEAEEVIQYKLVPERRPVLREVWRSRLRGCQAVVEDWGQIIQLRSLVMKPHEDLKTWLRFVGLCRRNGRFVSGLFGFYRSHFVGSTSPSPHGLNSVPGNTPPASTQPIAELVRAKTDLQRCMELHAAPSVRGFVNSISLSPSDSLRLINLLFKFGHLAEIREVIREGLTKISLENWLLVIQQLLARIDTPREYVASIIIDLLISVGHRYPQSMVYPLVLAFKSGGSDRRRYNANRILYSMEEHSPRLVSEAFLLNEELIRLSITWVELWFESLEDASRVYFGEKDIGKMFRLLHPLHQMMDRGHETIHEATFLQEHGGELANCRVCCETFERTGARIVLQQAWDRYYTLYRLTNMSTLELSVASPRLHEYGQDWQLAVPGTMVNFFLCVSFLTLGSNGHQYMFLLKGHEDTRQDERVMQFFGLVNTLLMNNAETLRRNLTIQRMSVIPLSTNTGLFGWVPNSDTLHSLIRDYREKTGTVLNKENREMLILAPDFDRLNVIQKTEIFEAGLRESSGRDLANILWLKSHSSEAWFERRTNFVRSMATMSMVGYILGLGDRHPSNIMLSRETGKVVHIDFGDCFEVAMMREKFPEKVPFRLTRMIIAAMEVTGIDGVYRQTCEMVLSLVRTHRESLLAVLEAFIYDPLLQWVLLENRKDFTHLDNKVDEGAGGPGAAGGTAVLRPPLRDVPRIVLGPTTQTNSKQMPTNIKLTIKRIPVTDPRVAPIRPGEYSQIPIILIACHSAIRTKLTLGDIICVTVPGLVATKQVSVCAYSVHTSHLSCPAGRP
ncbi:unnamed protein product [Echinostoma caproni]|uniref:non-specific serine/threonine protein kinase n=1 Tax=Echinostoma caproni TaxID=27848 RepID=A0A3P8I4W0_9TREM|nr:unnamed protein product [Echinostoma caproni]